MKKLSHTIVLWAASFSLISCIYSEENIPIPPYNCIYPTITIYTCEEQDIVDECIEEIYQILEYLESYTCNDRNVEAYVRKISSELNKINLSVHGQKSNQETAQ